jgi:transcription elongation factor Elf1
MLMSDLRISKEILPTIQQQQQEVKKIFNLECPNCEKIDWLPVDFKDSILCQITVKCQECGSIITLPRIALQLQSMNPSYLE